MKTGEANGSSSSDELQQANKRPSLASKPNEEDEYAFFEELPVILLLIADYNEAYVLLQHTTQY